MMNKLEWPSASYLAKLLKLYAIWGLGAGLLAIIVVVAVTGFLSGVISNALLKVAMPRIKMMLHELRAMVKVSHPA